jgi:hypothetical protein
LAASAFDKPSLLLDGSDLEAASRDTKGSMVSDGGRTSGRCSREGDGDVKGGNGKVTGTGTEAWTATAAGDCASSRSR